MNLNEHYNSMWDQALKKFRKREFDFDPFIDSDNDPRYGLTLIAKPSLDVKRRVFETLEEIRKFAPNQYYYPESDLHVTILSLISCYPGFTLEKIDSSEYIDLVCSAIESITPFHIQFSGITASPSCIIIRGFPEDEQLNALRNNLRRLFQHSDLETSLDERYIRQTAHMTAIRFKEPFKNEAVFIQTITHLKDKTFGSSLVDKIELVGTDWYHQKKKTALIHTFELEK